MSAGGSDRRDARGRERSSARAQNRGHRSAQAPSQRRAHGDAPRLVAFEVLRAVDASDAYANLVLPPLLRERGLRGRDAGFATELTYGSLRMRGRYDAILAQCVDRPIADLDAPVLDVLRLGVHQLLGMRVPAHAAVSETVALARSTVGAGPAQFVNAVLRRVSATGLEDWLDRVEAAADPQGTDETARLAVRESHPAWVVRALRTALDRSGRDTSELATLLAADNVTPRVTLVARPGLLTAQQLAAEAVEATRSRHEPTAEGAEPSDRDVDPAARWAPTAVVLGQGDPHDLPSVRSGTAGVQDEGSQLVALALAEAELASDVAPADARWLDLCAGPGGKAALLGAVAASRGATLVANEVAPHRAELVRQSVRALPPGSVTVQCADGRSVGEDEPGQYDRVLVDAPCSGLGALRRRPESRWRRTAADLADLGPLQRELLTSALSTVRVGGVVAYVTCSPHVAETQLVVKDVLRAHRGRVEQLDARPAVRAVTGQDTELGDRLDVQLWPHVHGTDAMYLALLRRTA